MRSPRAIIAALSVAVLLSIAATQLPNITALAAENSPGVTVDIANAQPRQVEDATVQAIQRDYARAWQTYTQAMDDNRAELLNASFVGIAKDKLTQAISDQKKDGLRRKFVDKGHRVEVVFYSLDGSALQLRDTAQVEVQLLDGDKVIHSENSTLRYVALLTPTENSWKIRVFEAVPGF